MDAIKQVGHTPGPWVIDPADDLPLAVVRGDDKNFGDGIAEIGERTPENEANARLIAAAPDLLVALRELFRAYSGAVDAERLMFGHQTKELYARVNAAIAKAEGR